MEWKEKEREKKEKKKRKSKEVALSWTLLARGLTLIAPRNYGHFRLMEVMRRYKKKKRERPDKAGICGYENVTGTPFSLSLSSIGSSTPSSFFSPSSRRYYDSVSCPFFRGKRGRRGLGLVSFSGWKNKEESFSRGFAIPSLFSSR